MIRDVDIKKIINKYSLSERNNVIEFVTTNPEKLNIDELSRIVELVNSEREATAAYYTDKNTLDIIYKDLPYINKGVIKVLEPSVGAGNFLQIIIDRYSYAEKLIIDVNDIDEKSIEIVQLLNEYRNIPKNVIINYYTNDFLENNFANDYDLIIGNPPFSKKNKKNGLDILSERYADTVTTNLSGFFLQESLLLSNNVVLIMPKYFLSNPDFKLTRSRCAEFTIDKIIDFGEKGFKGVLIETIAIFINKIKPNNGITEVYSVTLDIKNKITQNKLVSDEFPSWLIYRNDYFDTLASRMKFDIFTSTRDRQITNKLLSDNGDIRVIKSRNIKRDGTGIKDLEGYDAYMSEEVAKELSIYQYIDRDDIYLCPNMTYYPRVIKKPKHVLVNGSVAMLFKKSNIEITNSDLQFWSSSEFEEFYRIARNRSTRSLNIDSNSVYFFGVIK